MRKTSLALALTLGMTAGAWADTLVMRDGKRHEGRFISGSRDTITFETQQGQRRVFDASDVRHLEFDESNVNRSAQNRNENIRGIQTDEASGAAMIPAGAELQVRTNERIEANSAVEGRSFDGVVVKDIVGPNGNVVVPRGSQAELVVREFSEGGRVSGPELVLDLRSLSVGGTRYLVSSTDVSRGNEEGLGANKRTGKYVGGGAALGTILGAIAGGGRGAAIGAIAGAAAGAGAQVLTAGDQIKVPAETVLTFKLEQPVYLQRQ